MRLIAVPAKLLYVDDRLENWGRWARSGGRGGSPLGSAEGRYRPERVTEGEEQTRRTPSVSIDESEASAVDRAIAPANGFPAHWTRMLLAAYVWQANRPVVCRAGGINPRELTFELQRAMHAADNRLRRRESALLRD